MTQFTQANIVDHISVYNLTFFFLIGVNNDYTQV